MYHNDRLYHVESLPVDTIRMHLYLRHHQMQVILLIHHKPVYNDSYYRCKYKCIKIERGEFNEMMKREGKRKKEIEDIINLPRPTIYV